MGEGKNIHMSLDDMIGQDHSKNSTYRKTNNPYELKENIEKMKQRNERFANAEDQERRQAKIARMEKKFEWIEHKAPPLPIL